jgi:4-amino-4-deoxy-L-arabinose transferase-like glycosyltransferase
VTNPTTPSQSAFRPSSLGGRIVFVFLGLLALFVVLARLWTRNEPLERDITTYAVIGHEMLQGRDLYSDLWDIKPPGVYFAYAAAEVVAGSSSKAVVLVNIAAAVLSLLGVFVAASAGLRPAEGLWAAAAFAILSGNLGLQANQPNAEVFINTCLAWLLALLLRARGPLGFRGAVLAGVLLFLGTLFKPYVAVAGLLLAVNVLAPPPGTLRKTVLREAALAAGVLVAGWLVVVAYFHATSRSVDLYEVLVVYGRHYARDPAGNVVRGFVAGTTSLLPLGGLVAAAVAGFVLRRPPRARVWLLLMTWAFAVQVMIALPGRPFPHYLQLWLPALAVAFGQLTGDVACRVRNPRLGQRLESVLAALVVGGLLVTHLPSYALSPDEWSRKKYAETFILVRALGIDLANLLRTEESFFQFGAESGLYFYAHRSPPAGPLIARHYMEGPLAEKLQRRILRDLERKPPELVILSRDAFDGARQSRAPQPVLEWIQAHYRWSASATPASLNFPHLFEILGSRSSPFLFLMRDGGSVEARLLQNSERKGTAY